ncbi:sensor histidine kinase [Candidatus Azambacteria bacterium]|nr:sensor histidine kinase [Candidatus Azambacteria bacterium]
MKLNLRNKILILLILISLVPLALFATVGVYVINLAQQHNVAQLETQLLTQKVKEIEKFISETQTIFHVQVATQVSALSGIPSDQREFLLKEIAKASRAISEVSFLEYDPSYPDKPESGMELNKIVGQKPSLDFINKKNTPEFTSVVEGNDYFGPVYQKGDDFYITISAPVRNKDRMVIGVVSGKISLKSVERMVADGVLGNSGYLILTDNKGVIWTKPQRASFKGFGSNVYVQSVLSGEKGVFRGEAEEYVSSFGDLVIASAQKIRNLDWALVAEWPKNDAYEIVYATMKQAAVFFALILGVVVVAAFLFARRITKPVRILEEGTRAIGGGNLNSRILIDTRDEFETLASRFNEMAKNLKDIQELREVKARVQGLMSSLEKEKELSQIKDAFIATASHQLRTPVSVIRWITEGLRAFAGSDKKEEIELQLKDLSKNVEALALVIGDILTVAELGIGYEPKTISEFSLLEKTRETIEKFTTEAAEKKLTIALDAAHGEYKAKGSPHNITRVIEHLLDNAIAYTKEGGHILVELISSPKEITFSIKDDGIEVPLEDQKLVFGEFFRGKNSIEMKNVGTGLGLFIVKNIVEGHGGKAGVQSPADWGGKKAGARFYFTLPFMTSK